MLTKAQINSWIPSITAIFQKFMPCPTLPEILVVSERSLFRTRQETARRIGCRQFLADTDEYDAAMEMLHGPKGNAILIRQKYVPDIYKNPQGEFLFQKSLWHELGHYFAAIHEPACFDDFNYCGLDPNDLNLCLEGVVIERTASIQEGKADPNWYRQHGYWLWSEFIAEAIALHIDRLHCSIDNKDYYHPELLTWEPDQHWENIQEQLRRYLGLASTYYDCIMDERSLGVYFATILVDDITTHFIDAAREGKLKQYDQHGNLEAVTDIDPTCMDEFEEPVADGLRKIYGTLGRQMQKEDFWNADVGLLEELGKTMLEIDRELIAETQEMMTEMIAGMDEEAASKMLADVMEDILENVDPEEREALLKEWLGDQYDAFMEYAKKEGF